MPIRALLLQVTAPGVASRPRISAVNDGSGLVTEGTRPCLKCGRPLRAGTRFCEGCGASLEAVPADPPPHPLPADSTPTAAGPSKPKGLGAPSPADLGWRGALTEFRRSTYLAGSIAILMLVIEIGLRSRYLFLGWIVTSLFVAWRCFITVPIRLRRSEDDYARRAVLLPAVLNILFLGIVPGVVLLIAFFRSRNNQ